ncbi:MAG TPA: FtsX-like permease family protein [Candidatus Caccousia avistercoris]|nr:FtsX-like permease family protein [Candidatus Caccousia avistercoris]
MRIKSFYKDIGRAVTHSWSRFLALLVIVALGSGMYSGLRATAPDMRATADQYFDSSRFMDVHLVSTFGFTQEDVEAIRAAEGVENVMAGYTADVLSRVGERDLVLRLHSLPEYMGEDNGDYLNRPTLLAGRMPEKSGECVLSTDSLENDPVSLGDTIVIEDTDGTLEDNLARSEFTVVGFVESSYYISVSLGSSTIGSGTLDRYMYLLSEDFSQEYYTDLFATVTGAAALDTFTQEYQDTVDPVLDRLEVLAEDRAEIRYQDIRDEARQELDDAQNTYDEEKAKAEQELADAEQELLDAEQEVADGEQELADSRQKLLDAEQELQDGREELADAQQSYEDGLRQLEEGKQEYEDGVKEIADGREQWMDGYSQYLTGLNQYEYGLSQLEMQKEDAYAQLADARKQLNDAQKELNDAKEQLEEQKENYNLAKQLSGVVDSLLESKPEDPETPEEPQISSEEEAAAFLQELMGQNPADAMTAVSGLDESSKSYLSNYIQTVLENPDVPEEQQALLRQLLALLGGSGEEEGGGELTEDNVADFLQELAGMDEAQAAEKLMGLSRDELVILSDYLHSAVDQYEDGRAQISSANWQLREARAEYNRQKAEADEQFAEAEQELADAKAELDDAAQELEDSKAELDDGEQQLVDAKAEIEENEQKLADAEKELADGRQELADAEQEIRDGWQELADGEADLNDAKQELADGWQEYEDGRQEAEQELADGAKELNDARDELAKLERPEWYVLGRDANVGYVSFEGDCDRMESLSTVFPVMFFLVAALVALTTMTRMVEEERGVIGTYKALGYGRGKIASKYLLYAAIPTLLGSVCGVLLGFQTLPRVCWSAYLMMYNAPALISGFHWAYALTGTAASVLCTLGATWLVCRSELKETPAALLLPKVPKAGKRILLERLGFVWKRLKFTQKVTCRNLFRYKRRLFMTVVGIAGATGLLLTGFGIKDSIADIVEKQYSDIYRYDTVISLKDGEVSEGLRSVLESDAFSGWLPVMKKAVDIEAGENSLSGYVFVPQETERLKEFVSLRSRTTGEDVPFGEDSVVLTEKAADILGVEVGGTITLENESSRKINLTVTGITENYVYHYVYIAPELFQQEMNDPVEITEVEAVCVQGPEEREATARLLQEQEGVATAGFTEDTRASFDDLVESLNVIIVVIIFCAGALAFVVLYNLTNINITERQRELATIKVLGFFDGEVAGYIYRETTILSLLGCLFGLGFGVVLHSFVIQTVEVDMVMFSRSIASLSFLWSVLITMVFTAVVDVIMLPKMKHINMVESLKSVD